MYIFHNPAAGAAARFSWTCNPSKSRAATQLFYSSHQYSHSAAAESELSRRERKQQRAKVLDLLAALKECSSSRNIERGRRIHAFARETGIDSHKFVASTLVTMYSRCGSITEACKVFETIQQPDIVLWNSLLIGYVENEEGEVALDLFQGMLSQSCCVPTPRTFGAALKACSLVAAKETGKEVDGKLMKVSTLQTGRSIHRMITTGPRGSSDLFVASALMNMYSKCGSLADAVMVFQRMPVHDIVTWGSLMMGYAENGEEELALKLFFSIPPQGTRDPAIFVAALKACAGFAVKEDGHLLEGKLVKVEALERGMAVHSLAADAGFEFHLFVSSSLIDVYAKCRSMVIAQRVFDRMPCHNLVSWTSLMLGYTEIEDSERALALFSSMQRLTSSPDAGSFVSALKACTSLSTREEPRLVNGRFIREESLTKGMAIHSQIKECGCESDVSVAVSLVDMYSKCGSLDQARKVFESMGTRGIGPWTALALGYAENGEEEVALELFSQTQPEEALELDSPAFLAVLKACTSLATKEQGEMIGGKLVKLKSLHKGMALHSLAMRIGLESSPYVVATLVDMYSNCGSMVDARGVFDRMETNTPASWNALLLGYCENSEEKLALELMDWMTEKNSRTFAIALKACGAVATLETTKKVHAGICRAGMEPDIVLVSSLVDVYGKCGSMVSAEQMFNSCFTPDLVTYTSLIAGYSRAGDSEQVFGLFSEMQSRSLQANEVTLLCLLTACSHSGLVNLARRHFKEMLTVHRVEPGVEHYICMVDVLSRGNRLGEAVELVERMPFEASSVAWTTILGACWKWKNVRIGKLAFDRLVALDDKQSAAYDLMANIYGSSNMAEEKSLVQRLKDRALP